MSSSPPSSAVVAIVAAPRADTPAGTEFLRVLVALSACGRSVALVEIGRGVGALSDDAALTTDGSRLLDALAEEGIEPVRADPEAGKAVLDAIAAADAVMVLGDPERSGRPALLRLRRGERPTARTLPAIAQAGQVTVG